MPSKLDQLREVTTVVADTGDIEAMERFKPEDATTNPSLLLKAAQLPQYKPLLDQAIKQAAGSSGSSENQLADAADSLAVSIGLEILKIIPGRVSTEVDARLSFDTQATIARARSLMARYNAAGIANHRILIKVASTWEGIQAAQVLEKEGINCNLTLLFGFSQAAACADAGAFLISPFVGRILDWFKKHTGKDAYAPLEDPGVQSVTQIYNYYKQRNYQTVVMGASFRNTGEIEALAGCDRLTISPQFLEALANDQEPLTIRLRADDTGPAIPQPELTEAAFRFGMNADAMATEKLAEGIRNFIADQVLLENLLKSSS
jgi:transaldolase